MNQPPTNGALPETHRPIVIAVDGPAGAGKSSTTRALAQRLGIFFLDTGAMYRAATVGLMDEHAAGRLDAGVSAQVGAYVGARQISFADNGHVLLDGVDVHERIRLPAVTAEVWRVARNLPSRAHLVKLQQALVAGRDCVVEGRDATTVICPDATLKVYLDASPEERARRRAAELRAKGQDVDVQEVTRAIRKRDASDNSPEVGSLVVADDAIRLINDGMGEHEVVARIIALAVQRRPLLLERLLADQLIVGRSRQPGYVRVAQGSIMDPPRPWQLGLTNPSPDRLPHSTTAFACNQGGRQAGVLCQGRAVICMAGRGERPGPIMALPMLPQSWYVIEPGAWHAVVQTPGTICAWAESSSITETRAELDERQRHELRAFVHVYLGDDHGA